MRFSHSTDHLLIVSKIVLEFLTSMHFFEFFFQKKYKEREETKISSSLV